MHQCNAKLRKDILSLSMDSITLANWIKNQKTV